MYYININNSVYCLTDNDNETSLRSLCSILGGTYSHVTNEGSTHDEVISTCNVNNGIGFEYAYNTACENGYYWIEDTARCDDENNTSICKTGNTYKYNYYYGDPNSITDFCNNH